MTEARLIIDVQYDPAATDAEAVAAAMDRLLETALSTPGVLDEYGNPWLGDFYVVDGLAGAGAQSDARKTYCLEIDGPQLRAQRQLLLRLKQCMNQGIPLASDPEHEDLLEGLINLTDAIADQAHDQHGIDCLLEPEEEKCDCQLPGYFCSGVPGILAHMENGRLAPGAQVQRCDQCQRYPSDQAALERLGELGIA